MNPELEKRNKSHQQSAEGTADYWLRAELKRELEKYFDKHANSDILVEKEVSYSGTLDSPRETQLLCASIPKGVHFVPRIYFTSRTISVCREISYEREEEYEETVTDSYVSGYTISGNSISPDYDYRTRKITSTKYHTVEETVRYSVEVKAVKRGMAAKEYALEKELFPYSGTYSIAKEAERNGGKIDSPKGIIATWVYGAMLILFTLLAVFSVSLLSEFSINERYFFAQENVDIFVSWQLETYLFGLVFHADPIPICSQLGWDPAIAAWVIFGCLFVFGCIIAAMSEHFIDDYDILYGPWGTGIGLSVPACVLCSMLSLLFLQWVEDSEAVGSIFIIVNSFLVYFPTFLCVLFLNLKALICLLAPPFILFVLVKSVVQTLLIIREHRSDQASAAAFIASGKIEWYEKKWKELLDLSATN